MRVHEEQPFTPDDLPGYAGKLFDWAMANPDLMRLLAWSTLERAAKESDERVATLREKIRKVAEAQKAGQVGTAFPPEFILTAVMSLGTAWSAASPFGPSLDPKLAERSAALRKSIVEAVTLLADAGKGMRTAARSKLRQTRRKS